MNIKYVSPSLGRGKDCEIIKFLSKCKVYVDKRDYPEYHDNNLDRLEQIVVVPDGVQYHGKGKCLNWILDNEWDEDTDAIIALDDDISGIMRHVHDDKDTALLEEEFYELCERMTRLAQEWGCGLWGLSPSSDSMVYNEFIPFRLHGYMDGQVTGWVRDDGIRYDLEMSVKEDVDYALQSWQKYHKCLRVEKYYPKSKAFDNAGGCAFLRNPEREKEQFQMMQRKWGADIIRPNKPKSLKVSKIRGMGGAIKLNLPFKGA